MRISVGNLATATTSDELQDLFAEHGRVTLVEVLKDRRTGESKDFGFVEMPAEARTAIRKLDLTELHGPFTTVDEAQNNVGSAQPSTGS